MARKDIQLNDDGSLKIVNGDFVIGNSDAQHVQDLVYAFKGEYKANPLVGFGIDNWLKKTNASKALFERDLLVELGEDGYSDAVVNMDDGIESFNIEI